MKDRIFAIAHYADAGVLYLLIALSLVSIGVIIERYVRLRTLAKKSREEKVKMEDVLTSVRINDLPDIKMDAESMEGKAMKYALNHMKHNGLKGLEESFDTYVQFQQPRLERSLTFLATVGSNAPYIGLFGTVLGIMKSFHDLAHASSAGQQTVMSGISAALIATAAGLLVAIPNILAYNYFQKQVKMIVTGMENCRDMVIAYAKMKGN
ncbi:MAG: MotA/TolQ/ExbB proton channel family protein [Bdellovibrionales bacterium]|nr:MotA/TolQ/ExbB proton channel family protein [Bdellovibrionales bacterium]